MAMNRRAFLKLTGALFGALLAAPVLARLPETDGMQIWGAKTLAPQGSALEQINAWRIVGIVQRAVGEAYASFIEQCPCNDAVARQELSLLITNLMDSFQKSRVVYDFNVVCDETNNSPEVIDRKDFRLRVAFKDACTVKVTVIDAFIEEGVTDDTAT